MQFLIDTHVLIWFLEGRNLLSASIRSLIANPDNGVFVSIASIWEIAIKISIGKLTLANSLGDVLHQISSENIEILGIDAEHVLRLSSLPFHHRDPFDRMIV